MVNILSEKRIKAPVNRVFDFLSEPQNLPEIWPNIVEVRNIKRPKIGNALQYDWTYKMSGMRFDGKSDMVDYVLYERMVIKSQKGPVSTITWNFDMVERETQVKLEIEYEIPGSLLNKVNEKIIVQEQEHEVGAMLDNLKSHVELEMAYA